VKVGSGDVILLYTGRWKRRAALGPSNGFAGYHADVAYFIKERGVSFIGCDGPNDVSPSGLPQSIGAPLHRLTLVAMGVSIFDNLDFERVVEQARRLGRYEFLFMASPLRIDKGTGRRSIRWLSSDDRIVFVLTDWNGTTGVSESSPRGRSRQSPTHDVPGGSPCCR
jgi:kynurenine formamidase